VSITTNELSRQCRPTSTGATDKHTRHSVRQDKTFIVTTKGRNHYHVKKNVVSGVKEFTL